MPSVSVAFPDGEFASLMLTQTNAREHDAIRFDFCTYGSELLDRNPTYQLVLGELFCENRAISHEIVDGTLNFSRCDPQTSLLVKYFIEWAEHEINRLKELMRADGSGPNQYLRWQFVESAQRELTFDRWLESYFTRACEIALLGAIGEREVQRMIELREKWHRETRSDDVFTFVTPLLFPSLFYPHGKLVEILGVLRYTESILSTNHPIDDRPLRTIAVRFVLLDKKQEYTGRDVMLNPGVVVQTIEVSILSTVGWAVSKLINHGYASGVWHAHVPREAGASVLRRVDDDTLVRSLIGTSWSAKSAVDSMPYETIPTVDLVLVRGVIPRARRRRVR